MSAVYYTNEGRDLDFGHDPFKAIVAPRPIGWITAVNAKGEVNLSPYSFFNAISSRPNIVMFSSENKKDAVAFIEETGGDIDVEAVKSKLGMSEGQFMQAIEALQADGVLE